MSETKKDRNRPKKEEEERNNQKKSRKEKKKPHNLQLKQFSEWIFTSADIISAIFERYTKYSHSKYSFA